MIKDMPKLESPFVRKEINGEYYSDTKLLKSTNFSKNSRLSSEVIKRIVEKYSIQGDLKDEV